MTSSEPDPAPQPKWWSRLRARFGRSGLAVLALVAAAGATALWHALDGPNPWDEAIIKRTSQGLPLRPKEHGIIGLWWGSVATALISGVLLVTARLWIPGGKIKPRRAPFTPPMPGVSALFVVLVLMTVAAGLRAPRLGQSLWNDEEYAMRRFSHGAWQRVEPAAGGAAGAQWKFEPVDWSDTLFLNKNGNNHVLSSVVTRWSLDVWRFVTGEPRDAFNETALRMPALIAGILTLALIVALGTELAWPWIGVGAAGLLAFHPWHIRYAVESKGYSLMLFFLCLSLLGLLRAFRTNKASAWFCFAVGEAGCLLSFAGSLYAVLGINLMALLELMLRKEWRRTGTLIGFNLLAAMPVIVLTLPLVPQLLAYLARPDALRLGMDWDWARDAFTHLMAGIHYYLSEPEIHHGPTWILESQRSRLFAIVVGWLMPALAAIGVAVALFRNSATRLAIAGPVLGGAIAYAHNWEQDHPMVVWYLIYLLVPLALAVPLAVGRLLPHRERLHGPALVLLVTLFGWATFHAGMTLVRFDRQPIRQTVASIRDAHPEAMTAVFGVSNRQTMSYDPRVRVLESAADLDQAIADASAESRPLFVYFCGRTESGNRHPDLMKRIADPTAFKHTGDLPGLEAMFSYHVFRFLRPVMPRPANEEELR